MKNLLSTKFVATIISMLLVFTCFVPSLLQNAYAASAVNVIDSIVLAKENDPTTVLAEWSAGDPFIAVYKDLTSLQAVKLSLNWSDKNGTIDLQQGDYFTYVIPEIFDHRYISDASNVPIKNSSGDEVATYSIGTNPSSGLKEVTVTFTDFVDEHTDIAGDFWAVLYVGKVDSSEEKNLDFEINGELKATGKVTVNSTGTYSSTPKDRKTGYSSPAENIGGYYIFEWVVNVNMTENPLTGFHTIENFSLSDTIPSDSPHTFLTDQIRQDLGISPTDYVNTIGEYTGADSSLPAARYSVFTNHYNDIGGIWYDFIVDKTLSNGLTSTGIDGNSGLSVSNMKIEDKEFSADLGKLTRPTLIKYYTISTIKLSESALGDSEVAQLFKNAFLTSTGEDLSTSLTVYRFEAGGTAQGINGSYEFSFVKVNELGEVLQGAMFSLFASDNLTLGADRFASSDNNGVVAFSNLPDGTYYLQETAAPEGYSLRDTIYKVILNSGGFEIYWGDDFANRLSDNKIENSPEFIVQPTSVTLTGEKNLTGKTLEDDMFTFAIKNEQEEIVSMGTNDSSGAINFGELEFTAPGRYSFTVEEVMDAQSGIIYDDSKFAVVVTVVEGENGNLTSEVQYTNGSIVFNNHYDGDEPIIPDLPEQPGPNEVPSDLPEQPGPNEVPSDLPEPGPSKVSQELVKTSDETMPYGILVLICVSMLVATVSFWRYKKQ